VGSLDGDPRSDRGGGLTMTRSVTLGPVDEIPVTAGHGTTVDADAPPAVLGLWQALADASAALVEALEVESTCTVLGTDAVELLMPLEGAPGRQLRMVELAACSHLSPSGLTRRVDRLVAVDLVERVDCPGDRRGAYARLTGTGLRELRRALPHHSASLKRFVAPRLTEDAIDELIELLHRLAGPAPATDDPRLD